jgi:hypothetical protein
MKFYLKMKKRSAADSIEISKPNRFRVFASFGEEITPTNLSFSPS